MAERQTIIRARSMTDEVEEAMTPAQRAHEAERAAQVHSELEPNIAPFAMALFRLRNAIVLAEKAGQQPVAFDNSTKTSNRPVSARTVTKTVTSETTSGENSSQMYQAIEAEGMPNTELLAFFVGDNTSSMNTGDFAKIETRHIGMMGEGFTQLSKSKAELMPFRAQSILFGFPESLRIKGKSIVDRDGKDYDDFIEKEGVVAKEATALGEYDQKDLTATLLMQEDKRYRSGPTLLAPALDLVLSSLKRAGYDYSKLKSGQQAGVVLITGDFDIHDQFEAKAKIETLRSMGVRVIGVGIGGGSVEIERQMELDRLFEDGHGKHAGFCDKAEQVVDLIKSQSDLEDQRSGVDTTTTRVTRRQLPPARSIESDGLPVARGASLRARTSTKTEES